MNELLTGFLYVIGGLAALTLSGLAFILFLTTLGKAEHKRRSR